jgi:hypothetical protein
MFNLSACALVQSQTQTLAGLDIVPHDIFTNRRLLKACRIYLATAQLFAGF